LLRAFIWSARTRSQRWKPTDGSEVACESSSDRGAPPIGSPDPLSRRFSYLEHRVFAVQISGKRDARFRPQCPRVVKNLVRTERWRLARNGTSANRRSQSVPTGPNQTDSEFMRVSDCEARCRTHRAENVSQCRYCWIRVVRSPARPYSSIDACQDRNSSVVSL
jgi:hypothetical protein